MCVNIEDGVVTDLRLLLPRGLPQRDDTLSTLQKLPLPGFHTDSNIFI